MVVPQTPLHTARVLQEDKDHWDDVKVGGFCLSLYTPGWHLLTVWSLALPLCLDHVSDCPGDPLCPGNATEHWAASLSHLGWCSLGERGL